MKRFLNYLLNKQWILHIVMFFLSEEKKERIYIAKLRVNLAFFGHDTSDMTDEEMKEGVNNKGKMFSKCGITCDELAKTLQAMVNCT